MEYIKMDSPGNRAGKQFSTWISSTHTRIELPLFFRGKFTRLRVACVKFTNELPGFGRITFQINDWNTNLFYDGGQQLQTLKDIFVSTGDNVVTVYTNNDSRACDYTGEIDLTYLDIRVMLDGLFQPWAHPMYVTLYFS